MKIPIDDFLHIHGTPLLDKFLVALGISASASIGFLSLGEVQSFLVFLVTMAMIVPRAITNWEKRAEWKRRQKAFREHEEKNGMKFCDVRDPKHLEMD